MLAEIILVYFDGMTAWTLCELRSGARNGTVNHSLEMPYKCY